MLDAGQLLATQSKGLAGHGIPSQHWRGDLDLSSPRQWTERPHLENVQEYRGLGKFYLGVSERGVAEIHQSRRRNKLRKTRQFNGALAPPHVRSRADG